MRLLVKVAILVLSLACVHCYPYGSPGHHCSRDPGHGVRKKAGNNGFRIRVEDDPDTYAPGEEYTVSLTSTNPAKFLGFMLVAVRGADETESAGNLEIIDTGIAKYSDGCPHAITHTSDIPKLSVSFIWTAPPAGTGCVNFRATVVQQKEIWYQDDGALTLTLCEAVEEIPEDFQREIADCCACGSAKYKVTFVGQWTKYTHPKNYPEGYQNHWSSLTGASHSKNYMAFEYGGYATEGIRRVAEWGSPAHFETELKEAGDEIRTVIKTRALWPAIGNMSAIVSTDQARHLLTAYTMLGPSPDWCTGVSALDLCTSNCGWVKYAEIALYPWDAGTDSGLTYMAANSPNVIQEKIKPIHSTSPAVDEYPFFDPTGKPVKKVATLVVTRLDVKGDQCLLDELLEDVELKYEDVDYNLLSATDDDSTPPPRVEAMSGKGKRPKNKDKHMPNKQMPDPTMPPKEGMPPKNMEKVETMPPKENMERPTMPPKNMGKPDMPPKGNDKAPVDCMVSEWSEWSECSKTCGKHGKQLRRRMIKVRPKHGGMGCGKKRQTRKCNTHRCPVDCELGDWSQWSECTATCGEGVMVRTRPINKRAKYGGRECEEPLKNMKPCQGLPRC